MHTLAQTLRDCDPSLLPALAEVWKVSLGRLNPDEVLEALQQAMLNPTHLEAVWDRLTDSERGALQLLMASGQRMTLTKFEIAYGKLNRIGVNQVERDKPHKNPLTIAQGLFYKGLIALANEKTEQGIRPMVYIPTDLAPLFPTHKNAYANLDDEPLDLPHEDTPTIAESLPEEVIGPTQPADTTLVDDLTTLLAYLRIYNGDVEGDTLIVDDIEALTPYLLKDDGNRLAFIFGLGVSANLITIQEGQAYPARSGLKEWLSATRSQQVKTLVEAWRGSTFYRDLWHVPGLYPDPTGFLYDVLVGREALLTFLQRFVPTEGWWGMDDLIDIIKAKEPDFQRPGGDFDSWYIRNDANEYLRGYQSWDAIEGALLEFYLTGPLHWLGLCDLAEGAVKFTAYGRAWIGRSAWPNPPETTEKLVIHPDGRITASRRVSRADRFQVARFTSWQEVRDGYSYQLDTRGMQHGSEQGISPQNILSFLTRHRDPLPDSIVEFVELWQGHTADEANLDRGIVLRTVSQDVLDELYNKPEHRIYLGARLGPMACMVREEYTEALLTVLRSMGLDVEANL